MTWRPKSSPHVSAEDLELFEQAVGPVRRLAPSAAPAGAPKPAPEPVQSRLDEARVPRELVSSAIDPAEIEVGEELSHLAPGVSPRLLRRLKRGHFSVTDEFDLHEMNAAVARAAVKRFLDESIREGRLCVKIIHGKGLRSRAEGPVLKRLVDGLLRRRRDVVAFASAPPAAGGTGAVVVLLRRL
jgi:DNA-nicking Smr family endonuclease